MNHLEKNIRNARTAGFTLVEMLIALVLAGIVAGGVMTLLLRQNSFYGKNDDTIYAEQTMRGTAELVASELRMASPSDILMADGDSVQIAFDVLRGVVCGNDGSSDVYVYIYDAPTGVNLPSGRGTAVSGPKASTFQYDEDFDGSGSAAANTSAVQYTTCASANGGTAQSTDLSRFTTVDWSGTTLPLPVTGSIVRVFGTLTYSFAASGFTDGTALWRNDQELIAPFAEGAGFQYVMNDGSVENSVSSGSLADIRRIRISATATGSGSNRYDVSRDLTFDIPVRNVTP